MGSEVVAFDTPGVKVLVNRLRALDMQSGPRSPRNLLSVDDGGTLTLDHVEQGLQVSMLLGTRSRPFDEDICDLHLIATKIFGGAHQSDNLAMLDGLHAGMRGCSEGILPVEDYPPTLLVIIAPRLVVSGDRCVFSAVFLVLEFGHGAEVFQMGS